MLCLSMILRPPDAGPTEAGGYSALNQSLTLILHPARMPHSPSKKPEKYVPQNDDYIEKYSVNFEEK